MVDLVVVIVLSWLLFVMVDKLFDDEIVTQVVETPERPVVLLIIDAGKVLPQVDINPLIGGVALW